MRGEALRRAADLTGRSAPSPDQAPGKIAGKERDADRDQRPLADGAAAAVHQLLLLHLQLLRALIEPIRRRPRRLSDLVDGVMRGAPTRSIAGAALSLAFAAAASTASCAWPALRSTLLLVSSISLSSMNRITVR
ncbi:MAG TPA: hypothetical protein VGK75_15340 [Casimicrobiaceae bacterium]